MSSFVAIFYLTSAVLFILSLYGLSSPKTSRVGNYFGMSGMAIAIITTLLLPQVHNIVFILVALAIGAIVGYAIAKSVKMTAMPQLVAAFHSLVGLAAVFIAGAALWMPDAFHILQGDTIKLASLIEIGLGVVIGAITFTGSIVAFLKLNGNMNSKFVLFKRNPKLVSQIVAVALLVALVAFILIGSKAIFITLTLLAFFIGFILIAPVGGADMPVVVSMLNSYSGWAASGIGFTLANPVLIIAGALIGASGAILSYIMCKAMNRSIFNVMFSGFGDQVVSTESAEEDTRPVKRGSAEDSAYIMKSAASVIIVPGYGMAVAGAQHAVAEMVKKLEEAGVEVKFAIHPVAGRMPGHMNVLLAEASIDYDKVFELEEINGEFQSTDVAFVIGANDVTNPSAKTDKDSPIYGMPILDVANAKTVFFVKRSMAAGYAGVQNELFYRDNTMMIFGDAKKVVEEVVRNLD
jgi:NAD(P) transhydrogenase subunit beta